MQWLAENNEWFFTLLIVVYWVLCLLLIYFATFKMGKAVGEITAISLGIIFLSFFGALWYVKTYCFEGYTKVSEIKDLSSCQKKEMILENQNIFKYECPTIKQKQIRIKDTWHNLNKEVDNEITR